MNSREMKYFKKLLTEQLKALVEAGGETLSVIKNEEHRCSDFVEQASLLESRTMLLRIRSRESRLITKIRTALERIEDDTFGICEICEEEISIQRLKARPVTTQCIECKTRSETGEV